tara:strand:+ start:2646 stop:2837 length:192 start_codon:yes stop_codon:yes gene_type:complete
MIKLDVSKFRDLEHALKMFKKKIRDTKIMDKLRKGRYFEKPSITKRKKNIKAKYIDKKRREDE